LQLNSSKVTGTVLQAEQALKTKRTLLLGTNTKMLTPNFVLVLDRRKRPLSPCKPSMARRLLGLGKAAVFRQFPFTIILHKEVEATPEPIELKLDPGSKTTGVALKQGSKVLFGAELTHRGKPLKPA
jgi:RRXRR protein